MGDYTHWHPLGMQGFLEEGDDQNFDILWCAARAQRNGSSAVRTPYTEKCWTSEATGAAGTPVDYQIFPSGLQGNLHSHYGYDSLTRQSTYSPDDSFTFKSGVRIIEGPKEHSPLTSSSDAQVSEGNRLVCLHIGCKSKRTFGRVAELQRHIHKHLPKELFECLVRSCKYRGAKAFYRLDKCVEHMRKDHEFDNITCPINGCGLSQIRAELGKHVGTHSLESRSSSCHAISRLGFNYLDDFYQCPIEGCGTETLGDIDSMRTHIGCHPLELRRKFSNRITQLGCNWRYALYRCPVDGCETEHKGRGGFSRHLRKHQSGLSECIDALERLGFKLYHCPLEECDAAHFGTYSMSGHLSGHESTEVFAHRDDLVLQGFVIYKCPKPLCDFECFQAQADDEEMRVHIRGHGWLIYGQNLLEFGLGSWSDPLDEMRR
ncbi:MAG: hypothetical protein M1813_008557 [Trichoglossum hirsutum]|nr:MAG: hypothetical protein M1813_008557 [Trichoglossum hirsutum]